MSTTTDLKARVEQIRRAHASARPKHENPAWMNTHIDLGVALRYIDELERQAASTVQASCAECGVRSTVDSMWALYCLPCIQAKIAPALTDAAPPEAP